MLAVLAVALVVAGMLLRDPGSPGVLGLGLLGLGLIGLGAAVLVAAVMFPVIKEFEFGFPSGVKIMAAVHDREEDLRAAFAKQRGDLGLYTQLMCDDPAVAARLLEAAWEKTASLWRGPVTDDLRTFVLCEFVELLTAHSRWTPSDDPDGTRAAPNVSAPLASLPLAERVVVVLREFAGLPLAQIATLTERPLDDISKDLRSARRRVALITVSDDEL
ncbi:hypothetical protein GY21_14045 [Cryobacterium roopkundense]|uniref:RNA polymerase sigma factor 70 region 4 type 2 domain-containing protein n=1 Tax=Cryobacterium roopkundense TaxID=1001240 RepID=A0A099J2M5_9MICO|nr:hypothetical protein [Cryobacterium roopkundense]KGJ72629.1 hypothetical protein GY21_14045 [Cryobacterium roopkundense]MBB5641932.1 hypothetical protein [Cryobacterium roopkundense]